MEEGGEEEEEGRREGRIILETCDGREGGRGSGEGGQPTRE